MAIDPTIQQILDSITSNTQSGVEGQKEAAQIGADAMLQQQANQQAFLKEGAAKAGELYSPYMTMGKGALDQAMGMIGQGAPQYSWTKQFQADPWSWNKGSYQAQPWDEYAKTHLGADNIKSSPFYDLYQWQNQQQQEGIDKQLRARGNYGSGSGMTNELKAKTGLEQQFTADEYNRALQNYSTGEK